MLQRRSEVHPPLHRKPHQLVPTSVPRPSADSRPATAPPRPGSACAPPESRSARSPAAPSFPTLPRWATRGRQTHCHCSPSPRVVGLCADDGTLLGVQAAIPQRSKRSNWAGAGSLGDSVESSLLAVLRESIRGWNCRLILNKSTKGSKRRSSSVRAQYDHRKRVQVFVLTGALTHNHAQETNRFRPSAARAMLCQRACR